MPLKQINLLKKEKKAKTISPIQSKLRILLVILVAFAIIGGTALFLIKIIVSSKSKRIESQRQKLRLEIEARQETEGLYLTLYERLRLIETIIDKDVSVALLPEVIDKLLEDKVEVESLEANKGFLTLAIKAQSPRAVDEIIARFASGNSRFLFSNPIVEETEIDEKGVHNITFKLRVSNDNQSLK